VEFCRKNKLVVTNTIYQQHKRRRYTWVQPGDRNRYQLDYIMTKQRYRNSVLYSWSFAGADVGSDHNLVMASLAKVKLKKIKTSKKKRKWDLDKLKSDPESFSREVDLKLKDGGIEQCPNKCWIKLKEAIQAAAEKKIGYKNGVKIRKPWITEDMLERMEERRLAKMSNNKEGRKKYRALNNELRRTTEKAFEEWWTKECEDLEYLEKRGKIELMYTRIRELTEGKKVRSGAKQIKDKNGLVLQELEEIKVRWKEYIEDLYDKKGRPKMEEVLLEEENEVNERGRKRSISTGR